MSDCVYVDNSNVFIEGQHVAAVRSGMAMNIQDAMDNRVNDFSYKIDFGKLYCFICGADRSQIARAVLFGSRPPPNDSIWTFAKRAGFEVKLEDRNIRNKEKKIDTGIVAAMSRDAYRSGDPSKDVFTLVAGDADFVPGVQQLIDDGSKVDVVFWEHCSFELAHVCTSFVNLNPHFDALRL